MNMLVDGEWRTDVRESTNEEGEFEREETEFRDRIGEERGASDGSSGRSPRDGDDPDAELPAEPGRYHLYISRACPWAPGAALVRRLTGLTDVISMDVVDPYRAENGWRFNPDKDGCTRDRIHGADYLRELYVRADPDYTGRVSVPVLWDRERDTIVNNESVEIMRMLSTAFDGYGNGVDLYPEGYRDEIDGIIDDIYEPINNGVYRAGFAESQDAYDEAIDDLFGALDRWDGVLADRRYLAGDRLTLADLRLFPTLVRFDHVYHTHFMCNVKRVVDYGHLWPYLRDLYGVPGVAETVNMDHIKEHYYTTHPDVNPSRIVARGPDLDFEAEHDRDRLSGGPPEALAASPPAGD